MVNSYDFFVVSPMDAGEALWAMQTILSAYDEKGRVPHEQRLNVPDDNTPYGWRCAHTEHHWNWVNDHPGVTAGQAWRLSTKPQMLPAGATIYARWRKDLPLAPYGACDGGLLLPPHWLYASFGGHPSPDLAWHFAQWLHTQRAGFLWSDSFQGELHLGPVGFDRQVSTTAMQTPVTHAPSPYPREMVALVTQLKKLAEGSTW